MEIGTRDSVCSFVLDCLQNIGNMPEDILVDAVKLWVGGSTDNMIKSVILNLYSEGYVSKDEDGDYQVEIVSPYLGDRISALKKCVFEVIEANEPITHDHLNLRCRVLLKTAGVQNFAARLRSAVADLKKDRKIFEYDEEYYVVREWDESSDEEDYDDRSLKRESPPSFHSEEEFDDDDDNGPDVKRTLSSKETLGKSKSQQCVDTMKAEVNHCEYNFSDIIQEDPEISSSLMKSLNFHGQELLRAMQTEQGDDIMKYVYTKWLNYVEYHKRAPQAEFSLRSKRLRLLHFMAKKADELFKHVNAETCNIEQNEDPPEISSSLLMKSLNFHGQELLRAMQTEQGDNIMMYVDTKCLNYVEYHKRAPQAEFSLRSKRLLLLHFMAKKADELFKPVNAETCNIEQNEDLFAVVPPIEKYMAVPSNERRMRFFQELQRGDIVIGNVWSRNHPSLPGQNVRGHSVLHLICFDGKKKRHIEDLLIKGRIGSNDIPNICEIPKDEYAVGLKNKQMSVWAMRRFAAMSDVDLSYENFSRAVEYNSSNTEAVKYLTAIMSVKTINDAEKAGKRDSDADKADEALMTKSLNKELEVAQCVSTTSEVWPTVSAAAWQNSDTSWIGTYETTSWPGVDTSVYASPSSHWQTAASDWSSSWTTTSTTWPMTSSTWTPAMSGSFPVPPTSGAIPSVLPEDCRSMHTPDQELSSNKSSENAVKGYELDQLTHMIEEIRDKHVLKRSRSCCVSSSSTSTSIKRRRYRDDSSGGDDSAHSCESSLIDDHKQICEEFVERNRRQIERKKAQSRDAKGYGSMKNFEKATEDFIADLMYEPEKQLEMEYISDAYMMLGEKDEVSGQRVLPQPSKEMEEIEETVKNEQKECFVPLNFDLDEDFLSESNAEAGSSSRRTSPNHVFLTWENAAGTEVQQNTVGGNDLPRILHSENSLQKLSGLGKASQSGSKQETCGVELAKNTMCNIPPLPTTSATADLESLLDIQDYGSYDVPDSSSRVAWSADDRINHHLRKEFHDDSKQAVRLYFDALQDVSSQ